MKIEAPNYNLFRGDCLEEMKLIPDGYVDAVIVDLPYGCTEAAWDIPLDLATLWKEYNRIVKKNGNIIMFSQMPFSVDLINSNRKAFRYDLVYEKSKASGFLNANHRPMRAHELILIFNKGKKTFNCFFEDLEGNVLYDAVIQKKQIRSGEIAQSDVTPNSSKELIGHAYTAVIPEPKTGHINKGNYRPSSKKVKSDIHSPAFDLALDDERRTSMPGARRPRSVRKYKYAPTPNAKKKKVHPTQKPHDLLFWLVKTYSNENEIILDNTAGSGSTGVAALKAGRRFIGIEKDDTFFSWMKEHIEKAVQDAQ